MTLQIVASLTIVIDDPSKGYEAKVKHIYSTGVIYDRHLRSSKYVYNTGNWISLVSMRIPLPNFPKDSVKQHCGGKFLKKPPRSNSIPLREQKEHHCSNSSMQRFFFDRDTNKTCLIQT